MTPIEARAAVAAVTEPLLGEPLGERVESVTLEPGVARVRLALPFPVGGYGPETQARLVRALAAAGWHDRVEVELRAAIGAHVARTGVAALPGIANVIAVASGKGGVGKSTTAANLAVALALLGARVGLLDADIYGPSQPLMMGLAGERPRSRDGKMIEPLRAHGVAVMSIGFLVDATQPMVWRGPMVTQALVQLLSTTLWGELDYLVVDLPPGTGDIQLTLAQRVPVSGAVIVTTPQEISLADARKGLEMFRKVEVPVLGIVENMATHVCGQCGHEDPIFGAGGGARIAAEYGVALLGSLPLEASIRRQGDEGMPTVVADPAGLAAQRYQAIARHAAARLAVAGHAAFPTLSESDD